MDGISLECCWCEKPFVVCRSCWRGQRYCSKGCSKLGSQRSHRKAQKKYSQTPKGKISQRARQQTYRLKKSVTDGSTLVFGNSVRKKINQGCCIVCGEKPGPNLHKVKVSDGSISLRRVNAECGRADRDFG